MKSLIVQEMKQCTNTRLSGMRIVREGETFHVESLRQACSTLCSCPERLLIEVQKNMVHTEA